MTPGGAVLAKAKRDLLESTRVQLATLRPHRLERLAACGFKPSPSLFTHLLELFQALETYFDDLNLTQQAPERPPTGHRAHVIAACRRA